MICSVPAKKAQQHNVEQAKSMGKTNSITLKGISRTPYEFEIHPWDTAFSGFSAVYAVLKRVAHGYSIIYVSHTCNISDCFNDHDLKADLDEAGGTHVAIRIEIMASNRLSTQADLVASYMPVCNYNVFSVDETPAVYQVNAKTTVINKVAGMA